MEDQLNKILKAFKSIKPEEGFLQRSRQMIMASEQKPMRFGLSLFENLKLGAALALATLLLFVALGGLAYLGGSSGAALMVNKEGSVNGDFEIQIGQAEYNLGEDIEVSANVEEILKNLSL